MWYVYNLISIKNRRFYTGYTSNLKKRFEEHNKKVGSVYTSKNAPFKLIHYESFVSKKDATRQEIFYKSGYGKEVLKKKVSNSLLEL